MQSNTPPPLHHAKTAQLIIELHAVDDKLEVRLKPLDGETDPFASFGMVADHLASGAMRKLKDEFGAEHCRTSHGLNYLGLKIACLPGENPQERTGAVLDALKRLEATPEMVSGVLPKERRGEDSAGFLKLITEAKKKSSHAEQVEHILADTELTPQQRNDALAELRKKGPSGPSGGVGMN